MGIKLRASPLTDDRRSRGREARSLPAFMRAELWFLLSVILPQPNPATVLYDSALYFAGRMTLPKLYPDAGHVRIRDGHPRFAVRNDEETWQRSEVTKDDREKGKKVLSAEYQFEFQPATLHVHDRRKKAISGR
jgi:hypothetical protein